MIDPRWRSLADVLIGYSTRAQPGERVLVEAVEEEALPLAVAVYERALRAGAVPAVHLQRADLDKALLTLGSEGQWGTVPEIEKFAMEWADVYVGLRASRNPFELADADADRLAAHRRVRGELSALRNATTRWVLVRIPTEPLAQQAGMSFVQMEEMFFGAALIDWEDERGRIEPLRSRFQQGSSVRIVTDGTDLRFSTAGRSYLVGAGTHNIPDGEIYTAPVETSVEGEVTFNLPAIYGGRRFEGVHLRFEDGLITHASAGTNTDVLAAILDSEGARRIGEFGVGTNTAIRHYSGDILYDEKIAGTVHLALGRAYAECGGVHQSPIHWDLVLDLRTSGQLLVDDEVIFEHGRWKGM